MDVRVDGKSAQALADAVEKSGLKAETKNVTPDTVELEMLP